MKSLKCLQVDVQQFKTGKPISFMCLCSLAQLDFLALEQDINMVTHNRNYELKKNNTIFSLISCFWLNNIIFIEHIKLKISFRIFILSPVLPTLEHSCLDQRYHQLPHSYAPSVFTACLHCGNLFTHSFCVFSQKNNLFYVINVLFCCMCLKLVVHHYMAS